jgi:hypothetical protein
VSRPRCSTRRQMRTAACRPDAKPARATRRPTARPPMFRSRVEDPQRRFLIAVVRDDNDLPSGASAIANGRSRSKREPSGRDSPPVRQQRDTPPRAPGRSVVHVVRCVTTPRWPRSEAPRR